MSAGGWKGKGKDTEKCKGSKYKIYIYMMKFPTVCKERGKV
jgi:hypothetical protein